MATPQVLAKPKRKRAPRPPAKPPRGRTAASATEARREIVKDCMLAGYTYQDMLDLKDSKGRYVLDYRTIRKDMEAVVSEWLEHDKEWFVRSHISRKEHEARLRQYLKWTTMYMQTRGAVLEPNEALACQRALVSISKELHETECELDPEQYLNHLRAQKAEAEQMQVPEAFRPELPPIQLQKVPPNATDK